MSGTIENRGVKNACRVCLHTIFSEFVLLKTGNNWLEQYEYCFGLTLNENDEPRKLCLKCAEFMKEFVNFKKKCHDSHQYWKTISDMKCYSEDHKVKEEFDESLVKEETVDQENIPVKSDDIDPNINTINDLFEDNVSYEYDETIEDETVNNIVLSKIKNSKQKITSSRRKYNRKSKKDKEETDLKCNIHHCGLCDFISTDLKATTEHLRDHRVKNEFSCKNCNYEGYDFSDMIIHRYEHFPKGNYVICCECNRRFYCLKRLQFHYRSEHLGKDGGWCRLCDMTFKKYKTLRKHNILKHGNVNKYICDHCGKEYLFRNELITHLKEVAGVTTYICHTCGSAFKRNTHLTLHLNTVHKNDSVKCEHCGITYKNKYRLQHHLKSVARKKDCVCKICSKAFYHPVLLKEHEFFHTGERPFPCDICGKRLKKKNELKIHIERHRGIRRFKCTECSKDFVTNSQLRVHSAVHTGVRRHKCPYCERSFHERKLLAAHCLSKHNIEYNVAMKY